MGCPGAIPPRPHPPADAVGEAAVGAVRAVGGGQGAFLTGSAVFCTHIVGLGLAVAGVVTFFFAVPLGKLADRIGPRRM